MSEQNEYILGTQKDELFRLGIQHQIWASEAQKGWKLAGFKPGHTILDLGSGPGFATKELAFLVGDNGAVHAIDKSESYIEYLRELSQFHGMNVKAIHTDFNSMELPLNTFDGMYCRWALAWIDNPEEILEKVYHTLKVGGKMVIHEYYNWATHQTFPAKENLTKAIQAALKSFKEPPGDIDVGKQVPTYLSNLGMSVDNIRLMPKLGRPGNIAWNWPKSFYKTYFPRLIELGYLTDEIVKNAFNELAAIEKLPGATLSCPMMVEVVATKI